MNTNNQEMASNPYEASALAAYRRRESRRGRNRLGFQPWVYDPNQFGASNSYEAATMGAVVKELAKRYGKSPLGKL